MENVATYSEARSEYTKQLATMIVPPIVSWFRSLWTRNSSDRQHCLSAFQSECEEIPRWNQDRVHDEVRVLLEKTGCDYMEELMTAVFVAHTKVLTAVRLSTRQKKLSITVPKLDHFIHRVFRESARSFWKTPFLFMVDGNVVERQKNLLQIESLATEAITTAVRSLLPVKQILHDYLGDDQEEIEEAATVPEPELPVLPAETSTTTTTTTTTTEAPSTTSTTAAVAASSTTTTTSAVVSIDTEPSVHFAEYETVFDETKASPEIRYVPSGDDDEMESDGLKINENAPMQVTKEDFEDLDNTSSSAFNEDEVVVLE